MNTKKTSAHSSSKRSSRIPGFVAGLLFFALTAGTVHSQVNLLANPSFELGTPGGGFTGIVNWFGTSGGGDLVTVPDAHNGTNIVRLYAYGSGNRALNQEWPVTVGQVYEVDGWLKTEAGAQNFSPVSGFCEVMVRFYNASHTLIGEAHSPRFNAGGPTTWTKFSSGPLLTPMDAVSSRVSCAYWANGDTTTNGWVYYDDMHAVTSTAAQAGAIRNCDFETQPNNVWTNIPYWKSFGNDGLVGTNYARSGRFSLRLYYPETLLGQYWGATAGTRYASSGYLMTPGFVTTTSSCYGAIITEFLNAGGTVITAYASTQLTTNSAKDTWISFSASGIAPVGTVSGRTMCALLGHDDGYSGSIYFDDVTQRVVSSTGTISGVLRNPGYEDGPPGNAYDLDAATNFPYWGWIGGTNAGFVTTAYKYEGDQALSITYPSNMAVQRVSGVTGMTYVLEGYISSPVTEALSNNAYATMLMEFYSTSFNSGTSVASVVQTELFTSNKAAGTWHKFAVTNWAPASGSVTCRVINMVSGNTVGWGGAVYFDGLTLSTQIVPRTKSQNGLIWNNDFEFTAGGTVLGAIDNWIALGNAGSIDRTYSRGGNNSLKLYAPETLSAQLWAATPGYRYANSAYVANPSSDRLKGASNLHAVVLLQFTDASGTNVLATYESPWLMTNCTPNTWSNLSASGMAPASTVYGRTVLGLLGTNLGFSGSVNFDDVSQSTVSTGGTMAGVIHNGSFEDGIPGNCNTLSNDLPYWTWRGGTNAGFIVNSVAYTGSQSLAIVAANNLLGQDFVATTGATYIVDGYMMTPSGDRMTGTTAFASILLEFFNSIGGTDAVSGVSTFRLTNGTPADTWIKFSVTNHAPWNGTWITGRVSCAVLDLNTNSPYGGTVYFDGIRVTETNIPIAKSQSGLLWNPGFEYTANATKLPYVDNWTGLGLAGLVGQNPVHGGQKALQIYAPETLCAQYWSATPGWRYTNSAWVVNPSSDRLKGASNLHAVVLLQFTDATATNVLLTYESPWVLTNTTADTWYQLGVQGVAPAGAVSGRTVVALLGTNVGFSGSVWFDDATASLVSTGGTMAGEIHNGGFDDGAPGNCNTLSNALPYWRWAGGTNAGFIVSDTSYEGGQSLVIVAANNLLQQDFAATTGMSYIVDGYMMTPSANRMTSTTAFASFLLEFYNSIGGTDAVSSVSTIRLTNSTPADTWIKFSVTNRAPNFGAWVTGRVSCAILDLYGSPYGGSVYFDSVRVTATNIPISNSQSGALWNPGFEYTAKGTKLPYLDNWSGLGLAGLVDNTYKRSGNDSLKIYVPETLAAQSWNATPGYRYSSTAYAFTPSETAGANLLSNPELNMSGSAEAPPSWTSFDDGSHEADIWHYVSPTNGWMFYWGGGLYQDVTSGFAIGERYTFGGSFWMEGSNPLRNGDKYGVIQLEFYNATNGLIESATAYPTINSNSVKDTWFGSAGSAVVPPGTTKMRVLVRCNVPTAGDGAFTADDIFLKEVPAVAEKFTGPMGTHGTLLLQYLNTTGGVLVTYESPWFTENTPAGAWTSMVAAGVAPAGTVSGRTLVAILGTNLGYSGAIWFDDVSQSLVSTGATQSGLIWNGGFDDGITGDAYFLSNNLPNWTWYGGSNAGFVVSGASQAGGQSLTIVYPNNLAGQDFPATTGLTYIVEGYMMTPSANPVTGSTSYATMLLEFLTPAGGVTSVSVVGTAKLTNGTPTDTWIKFGVTNRAPNTGAWVTGRVSCAYLDTIGGTVGGQVYFDSLRVTVTTVAVANTTSGSLWNPGFEFTPNGTKFSFMDNWLGLGLAGNIDNAYVRSGSHALKIYVPETLAAQSWSATPGYRYSSAAYLYTPAETAGPNLLSNPELNMLGAAEAPTNWTGFDTGAHEADIWNYISPTNGWMFYWSGGIYQDITTGFTPGERYQFGGAFWMSGANPLRNGNKYGVIQAEFYNATNGLISTATAYPTINSNSVKDTWFDSRGSANVPQNTAKIRVVVRCNVPDSGDGSFTTDDIYVRKVPTVAERFTSPMGAHGVVLLQFLDSTGTNVLQTSESPYFTTGTTAGAWTFLQVTGRAPVGAVSGRTLLAILGTNAGYSGALWFDDVSHSVVSTGGITQSGVIYNGEFEDGPPGNCNVLSNDLPFWTWRGGTNAGFIVDSAAHSNAQSLAIVAANNLLGQDFAATTGMSYVVEGWLMTPSANRMTGTTAFATFLLEFFNPQGATDSVSVVTTGFLTNGTPADTWIKVSVTNRAPNGGAWVTGRVTCAVLDPNTNSPYGGTVYFDSVRVTATNLPASNSQSGLLWNPGFEYSAKGTKLLYVDNWTGLGLAGNVDDGYARSGSRSLKIYAPETLCAQTWGATQGWRYSSSAYVMTPSADRLCGVTNLHAVLLLQYFDATGTNLLITYESAWFKTNSAPDVWSNLSVIGVAPMGAKYGRTVVSLLGTNIGFSGSVRFDDVSQGLVSTGTASGLIRNPGYDDGTPGNAYNLYYKETNLPAWKWYGGTNAGFVARDYKRDNEQALVITYPQNGAGQDFAAASGLQYKAEGYLFTPSTAKFTTDGNMSYGCLEFTFYVNGDTNPVTENTKISEIFGGDRPADTWIYFAVTGTAPNAAIVTGRISCVINSPDPQGDFDLGGVIYFDSISVMQFGGATSAWQQWQLDNFGSTTGPNTGLYDDWDVDGFVNWSEYIAGTQPTNNQEFLGVDASRASTGAYIIRWSSEAGRRYSLRRTTNLVVSAVTVVSNNIAATVPENVYTDSPPAGVAAYYYRVTATTNQP